jgi:hypothetical protein
MDEPPLLSFSPVSRIRRAWRRMQIYSMSPATRVGYLIPVMQMRSQAFVPA